MHLNDGFSEGLFLFISGDGTSFFLFFYFSISLWLDFATLYPRQLFLSHCFLVCEILVDIIPQSVTQPAFLF